MMQALSRKLSFTALFRFLLYTLISVIVIFYFQQSNVNRPQVNLSLHTDRPELIQIFCDDGNGFSEALSSANTTSTAQQNGDSFSLSLPSACKRLRLDFGRPLGGRTFD
jgi:hypothetical protein